MAFSYNKLWKLLIDKNMKKVTLRDNIGISPNTLACLSKDKTVHMHVLGKICKELNCNIGDIVDYIDDTVGGSNEC
ncbi:helix-turn-helix domain-containing protein [Sedimentibacter saalensis]|uniref:helix-turn-helix domain-containing protein n=1 Tax=Sedimentibacter saalensis TaxID=130788 RepID=UPI0028A22CEF|nr:helix-turn-helix transcriptional regulator [Sedimentibacter saalensis]